MTKPSSFDALLSLLKDDAEYHMQHGTAYGRLIAKAKKDPILQEKLRQIDRAIKELDAYVWVK
jgi:hypothetical protein